MHVSAEVPSDDATDTFLVASRALVGVAAASLAELDDITLPQFRALVVLSNEGRATVGALAAFTAAAGEPSPADPFGWTSDVATPPGARPPDRAPAP